MTKSVKEVLIAKVLEMILMASKWRNLSVLSKEKMESKVLD